MSLKPFLSFQFGFRGDGASTSIAISTLTGPVQLLPATGAVLSPVFDSTPSDAANVSCSGGISVNSATISLGVLTVNFGSAPANGTEYIVSGIFEY